MSEIREAVIPLEAKKHAYRQTQDGIVISFVVHHDDMSADLAAAPLGTRYQLALVQLADDETPVPRQKPIALSQQSAILCGDPVFIKFLEENYEHLATGVEANDFDPASMVRQICGVDSRAEFDTDPHAAQRWRSLKGGYDAWRLT